MDFVNRTLQKPTGSQSFPLPEHLATLLKPGYEPPEAWSDGAMGCNSIDILRTALTRALTIALSGARLANYLLVNCFY